MKLTALKNKYAVWQPEAIDNVNLSALSRKPHELFGLNITVDEISVVCSVEDVPKEPFGKVEQPWRGFKIQGPLDFGLTGILASIANPLAEQEISIFAISTYDTDYVLVKEENFEKAKAVLGKKFEIGR